MHKDQLLPNDIQKLLSQYLESTDLVRLSASHPKLRQQIFQGVLPFFIEQRLPFRLTYKFIEKLDTDSVISLVKLVRAQELLNKLQQKHQDPQWVHHQNEFYQLCGSASKEILELCGITNPDFSSKKDIIRSLAAIYSQRANEVQMLRPEAVAVYLPTHLTSFRKQLFKKNFITEDTSSKINRIISTVDHRVLNFDQQENDHDSKSERHIAYLCMLTQAMVLSVTDIHELTPLFIKTNERLNADSNNPNELLLNIAIIHLNLLTLLSMRERYGLNLAGFANQYKTMFNQYFDKIASTDQQQKLKEQINLMLTMDISNEIDKNNLLLPEILQETRAENLKQYYLKFGRHYLKGFFNNDLTRSFGQATITTTGLAMFNRLWYGTFEEPHLAELGLGGPWAYGLIFLVSFVAETATRKPARDQLAAGGKHLYEALGSPLGNRT